MGILKHRSTDAEIMDDLECSGPVVEQTLREIEVINKWLGGNHVTITGIQKLLDSNHSIEKIRIADIGCGGGDMLVRIARWARKRKIETELIGIDANPYIIEYARKNTADFPEIQYEVQNVLSEEFRSRKFDIVTSTLFAHHFSDEQLEGLLGDLHRQSEVGIVINDLHRHGFAFHSIRLLTRLFSRSEMVRFDAPLSVLRGFRKNELLSMMDNTGIRKFSLSWHWAFRWRLVIQGTSA